MPSQAFPTKSENLALKSRLFRAQDYYVRAAIAVSACFTPLE